MYAAVRPYVTAGAILVGSSVIAATPIAAPPPDVQIANPAVRLAADSIANVPVNLFYALVNVPANEVYALNSWADALEAGGSWYLKTPTNVWGWDPGNPPMLQAGVAVLVPFPVISGNGGLPEGITPNNKGPLEAGPSEVITDENSILGGRAEPGTLGYMLNVLIAAEMPMHEGCAFTCPNLVETAQGYFRVPLSALTDPEGYYFGEVVNPSDPEYPVAWSGQTAEPLNPLEPFTNFWASLTADPSDDASQASDGIKVVTFEDLVNTGTRLFDSGVIAFSPWFRGSYLFTGFPFYDIPENVGGWIAGLTKLACPTCDSLESPEITTIPDPGARTLTINAASSTPTPDSLASGDRYAGTAEIYKGYDGPVQEEPLALQPPADPPAPVRSSDPVIPAWRTVLGGETAGAGQAGEGGSTSGGRPAGAVKSVTDRAKTTVSRIKNRVTGDSTETGEATSGGIDPDPRRSTDDPSSTGG